MSPNHFLHSAAQSAAKLSIITLAVLLAGTGLVACNRDKTPEAAAQKPDPTVDVQTIELDSLPLTTTLSGRTVASELAEVRPQVSGIIDEVLFQEGAMIQKDQPLYRINAANYESTGAANEAALMQAEANVGTARAAIIAQQAQLEQARADLARLNGLLEVDAIAQQTYDQAITNVKTAEAGVLQAQANLASSEAAVARAQAAVADSKLNLERTIVRAPISGRSGISSVTKGALVSSGQAAPLVTISKTNPIYVDIVQSSADILRLREALSAGEADLGSMEVELILEDGSIYPQKGTLIMDDAKVDENTGAIKLRAVFDNPNGVLIGGMFVNARLQQSILPNAVLLPQSAVMRTPQGQAQVYVVTDADTIAMRDVVTRGTLNGKWIVSDGLKSGDKVVVLGGAKVKPEQKVQVRVLPDAASDNSAMTDIPSVTDDGANLTDSNHLTAPKIGQNSIGQNSVMKSDNAPAKPMPNDASTTDGSANKPATGSQD